MQKKFIIVGYDRNSNFPGKENGWYFELGWELIKTRLALISLIKEEKMDKDSVYVVTQPDRKFFYSKFCKNVISHEEYNKLIDDTSLVYDLVQDMINWVNSGHVWKCSNTPVSNLWQSKTNLVSYKYTKEEAPLINEFDLLKTKIEDPFVCMVIRKRKWVQNRGMTDEQIKKCFEIFKEKQLKVFIMGNDAEEYANNDDIVHISLQNMASLINDDKCKSLITPLSGGGLIRFFTGKCPMITFDLQNHRAGNESNPLFWSKEMIFSNLDESNWKIVNNFDIDILKQL